MDKVLNVVETFLEYGQGNPFFFCLIFCKETNEYRPSDIYSNSEINQQD